jgi:riboflavin synthase
MFSGLVEEAGRIESVTSSTRAIRMVVRARKAGGGVRVGDSVAVNGCCLTAVKLERRHRATRLHFDLLQQTWRNTSFAQLSRGRLVNLERSLRLSDRLGGHFVTGHIDGTGKIVRWERSGSDWILEVRPARQLMRYLIDRGSVAIDGISLTVAEVFARTFRVWIIPHTYEATNLRERVKGELVNLEADLVAKHLERLIAVRSAPESSSASDLPAPLSNTAR